MSDATKVTTGKPMAGGAVFCAPVGSALPTDTTTQLNAAFKNMGYISEDGVTNSNSPESETIKAWGGDTVLTPMTGKEDTFGMTFIEAMNVDVLKAIYGPDHVTGELNTGIAINVAAADVPACAWVIDMILAGNVKKRIVIPSGKITEIGEITYTDAAAVGYETTISAAPDGAGNTHYEYIKAQPAAQEE